MSFTNILSKLKAIFFTAKGVDPGPYPELLLDRI